MSNKIQYCDKAVRVLAAALSASAPVPVESPLSVDSVASPFDFLAHGSNIHSNQELGSRTCLLSGELAPWTKSHSKRFNHLAKLEALGNITEQQQLELEELSIHRRRSLFPRTTEEIISEIKQREALIRLRQALNECAKVIPANQAVF